jgi:hypothetical protein
MMKRTLLTVLACLAATGCGDRIKSNAAAESQAVIFHQQYNNEDLAAIVTTAHPDMLKSSSESEIAERLGVIRGKLGKATRSKTIECGERTTDAGTTVVLVQNTTFENGKGREKLTFRIQDGKALLVGYEIDSRDLILDQKPVTE